MSTHPESGILLVGLTGTGKTNFLVGLDVVLDNQTDTNGLVHSDHAADRTYLEPLRAKWMRGEQLAHTSRLAPPPPHQLLVRHPASGVHATFSIPDLAGETFDSQFVTRSFSHEFVLRIQRSVGMILFLHCAHEADHELLEHPQFMDAEAITKAGESPSTAPASSGDWSIEQSSKQVKLVDLLQFATELREFPLRVAVAISAWDQVENAPIGVLPKDPALFVARQWPLLTQYLESNRDKLFSRVYGVSARGGGSSAEEIARLTKLKHPRERVIVVDGNHRSNDLTRPVRWLLGLLDATDSSNA